MEPVNVIRAPSLKRGKNDESLNNRVSIKCLMKHKGSKSLIKNNNSEIVCFTLKCA